MKKCLLSFLSVFIASLAVCFNSFGQEREITGTVSSMADGTTIPGVNVVVSGTSQGTITDINGEYRLTVGESAKSILFSYVGFEAKEVPIGNQSVIDVQLAADLKELSEVVVVGYGTQERAEVTGAVGGIKADQIKNKPIINPDQALAGTIAGVNISNRSGDPAAPINVRIRGVGTFGNNKPLWVIDGVPIVQTENVTVNTSSTTDSNPLAGINPDDIESIDVLKDASAAAIYGARAANGVIIVTTKRGTEGKAEFTYSGYYGQGNVRDESRREVLNVEQFIDIQTELGRDLSQFRGREFVDWQDLIFRSAPRESHNLSINGGSKSANYFVSGGYLRSEGIEPGQDFERYTVKANSDITVGRFKFGESILISETDRLTQSEGGGLFAAFGAAQNAPWFQPFDPNGPFGFNQETVENLGQASAENKLFRTDPRVNATNINTIKILGNVYGQFEILEGLTFKMAGGVDWNIGDASFFQENVDYGQELQPSRLVQSRPIERTTNWVNTLTYERTFGEHSITTLLGWEETNFRFDKIRLQGNELFNTNIKFASVAAQTSAGNEADQWALRGLLGRVNYNYAGRYLFTFNVRRDASSRFAEVNRSDIFPSLSVGWRLTEEEFFPQSDIFDDVKVRGSWGQSGNQFTGTNFAFLSSLATTIFYVVGEGQDGIVRGPAPVNFANRSLMWETSNQINIGTDISLFQGRMQFVFDYYQKTSKDVLVGLPVPFVSGFFLPADANLGEIRNKGIELGITYQGSIGELTYSVSGNFTTTDNEVLDLGSVNQIITGTGGAQTHRTIEGESLGHFFGFQTDGIFQTQEEADAALPDAFSGGAQPGDIRFVDTNGDGQINSDDRTILGSPIPDFFYGGNIQAGYKGFDFSVQLRGEGDNQVFNEARSQLESLNGSNNFSASVLNRWTGPNTSNSIPRATEGDPNSNNRFSDRWIEDAAFLRINNIQLGYTIPNETLENITDGLVRNFRAYFGVFNAAVFTDYSGPDPEVTRAQSFQKGEFPLATGQDDGASPQPRVWQLGWSLTF